MNKFSKRKLLIILIAIVMVVLVIIGFAFLTHGRNIQTTIVDTSLPDISYFKSNPANLFILKDTDFNKYIESDTPFFGVKSQCPHTGGHINFVKTGTPYTANIITPVDGVISRVDTCFDLGTNDKFDISVDFAQYNGQPVSLDYSIEPFAGLKCKNNPDFYKQYIFVQPGQKVKAGDVIGEMPKFTSDPNSGTHIHFNLSTNGKMVCPNIFSDSIINEFAAKPMQNACNGQTVTAKTFCYMAGEGEDILN